MGSGEAFRLGVGGLASVWLPFRDLFITGLCYL
jgi:hypothetical protein